MSRVFLKGLSLVGLCYLALTAAPSTRANDPSSTCPQQCDSCPGYARTGCHDCCLKPIVKWALCKDYYILPPDYGWNAPVKVPVVRRGVTYYRYWPEQWYGTGSAAVGVYRSYPQVYSPTDTTQLGYYYQHVPYWLPANRLPPPPLPSHWHVREPHRGYHGRWHDSYTAIHHHQSANVQYWVEPLGNHAGMQATPVQTAAPMGTPPAPASNAAPKRLEPGSAAPAPPVPAPPVDGKSAAKVQSRMTSMLR